MISLFELFNDYTFRTVALGTLILGLGSGALGSFAFLRRQSLLGDAVSHAALPGIVLAYLLLHDKNPLILLAGAGIAGAIGALSILGIVRNSRIDMDGAQALVLSVFFGLGLMLLSYMQGLPDAGQAGLDKYLFGQAAALLEADLWTIGILESLALGLVLVFWKEIKLSIFDPHYGTTMGFSHAFLEILLTVLLVSAIVVGLSTVGVILMSAMLVAPAAAARQWTNRLGPMVLLSALFGGAAGVAGAYISASYANTPTGPVIVLALTVIGTISFLFSPSRGVLFRWIKRSIQGRVFAQQTLLLDLYRLGQSHSQMDYPHKLSTLESMDTKVYGVKKALEALEWRGFVIRQPEHAWSLTAKGIEEAKACQTTTGGSQ